MYISKIKLTNFRNFKDKEVEFNNGINVIIGHNNAGKTNLIKALSLVIDFQGAKRLDVDDFNRHLTINELKANPPKISIAVTISGTSTSAEPDDLTTISNWLTKLETDFEALLTYEFFLPEREKQNYIDSISHIPDTDTNATEQVWKVIKHNFIRLYTYKIWGGNTINQTIADSDSLKKFDFQFLDAIRDVERDMLTGRNTLLREVLDFFMDYDIKVDNTKTEEVKQNEIKAKKTQFSTQAESLLNELKIRMLEGKNQILSYANETGASFNKAKPDFEGSISDVEMYSVLKLIIEHETGIKIPATHNGLGYNNLIFMSLLLAKMQVNADGNYLGSNAKVFTTLAIEEPEAHLHPAMQYKFLKFLKENRIQRKVRQIFVTTHSTHITSAVSLDELICLHNDNNNMIVAYPGKVFNNDDIGNKAKNYVQRFLDATKSDMLFAHKVILVEGMAEQLLLSTLAKYVDSKAKEEFETSKKTTLTDEVYKSRILEDNHITVINVGGRYFDYFLKLFDSTQNYTIHKKIACLTDRDPEKKKKSNGNFKKCYPFEYDIDKATYEYKYNDITNKYPSHLNIKFFSPDDKGKTFEYDLIIYNPKLELLVTESMKNSSEIKEIMSLDIKNKPISDYISELRDSDENTKIINGINANTSWGDEDKKKAIIASRYLNSVGKGENALELVYVLEENLSKKDTLDYQEFIVPDYIKQAIEWICQP